MFHRITLLVLLPLASSTLLHAQSTGVEQQEQNAQKAEELNQKRLLRSRNDPMALLDLFTEELNLDEPQRQETDRLLSENRRKLLEVRASFKPPAEGMDRTRALVEKLRLAKQAGDAEAIRTATDQLREIQKERESELAPMRQKMAEIQQELHDQIAALLHEDQKQKFEELWEERMGQNSAFRGRVRSPQALKAMVDRLPGLTEFQKTQIDQQFRSYHESVKDQPSTSQAREQSTKLLYDSVTALLTTEQRETIARQMAGRNPNSQNGDESQPADGTEEKPK